MITEKYKPDILVRFWCEEFDDNGDFDYCYTWATEENGGGSLEDEEVEKIDKHYEKVKSNITHEDMIKLLEMTEMRGCQWEVLSKHYIKEKE